MENTKFLKRSYQKPSIKSEKSEMNAAASHGGGTCSCSGGSQGSFVQNAIGNWLS